MTEFWSKMPLSAPMQIRCSKRLFILGIVLFKIGGNAYWQGNIRKIVEIANENTPLDLPRWTYAKVDYILRWLRREGWLFTLRPSRSRPLQYYRSSPSDILPFSETKVSQVKTEEKRSEPKVEIYSVKPSVKRALSEYEAARDPEVQRRLEEFDAAIGYSFSKSK